MAKAKILVVDDSPVILETTRLILEEAGYQVVTLDNPLSMAHAVRKDSPDLVLLDVEMPAVRGDDVASIAGRHGATQGTPVVLYSDLAEKQLQERTLRCGAVGFIRKTNDEDSFLRQVEDCLKKHRRKGNNGTSQS